ncbi:MAG: LLM class F420-dependent oxidoreductase [Candidatus Binataceae bacterium]
MKFATFLYQTTGPEVAAMARRAEEFGFESLWVPDHIVIPAEYQSPYPYAESHRMPGAPGTPFLDPMLALCFAAASTSKIRLATGVMVLPMRNPFAVAKAVATLDVLSGGRFIFGVGIGWLKEEFDVIGMDFGNRARRTRESLAMMKELWTKEDPNYQGTTTAIREVGFMPKPVQQPHPPIVLGGDTDPSLKRAAQIGDGWYGIMNSLESASAAIARLREFERRENRAHPLEITVSPRFAKPLTPDDVLRLAAQGVERILLPIPRAAHHDAMAAIERLHRELITKS